MEPSILSAMQKGLFQQIRFLIEFGQDVNERDSERRTPLINCTLIEDRQWCVGLARLFIEKGAILCNRDKRGLNALHYACIYNKIELVKLFLQSMDFDLNQGDKLGNTALQYAASSGNVELTELLVRTYNHYKLSVDKLNKRNITPLLHAWKNGHVKCARILTELGNADCELEDSQEGKSAHDYENELVEEKENSSTNKENQRPPRPRTAVGGDENGEHRRGRRPKSAMSTGTRRQRVRSALQSTSLTNLRRRKLRTNLRIEDEEEEPEIYPREKLAAKPIRSASLTELRNRPEYIFQVTPAECFINQSQRIHRPHTTKMTSPQLPVEEAGCWRSGMRGLYTSYDFQFTASFRRGAVPPDPEHFRASSPNPSDCTSEAVSDRTLDGRRSKLQRKQSMASMNKYLPSDKNKKGPAKPTSRRNSIVSQVGVLESSSNESVNSQNKIKRRSSNNELIADDCSDVSSASAPRPDKVKDRAKSPRAPTASRKEPETRTQSRANHHGMHVIQE